ncbi:NUDIX hydrolase [Pseudonocardia sp. NPDC046786]|uniref:NUDIX hydrolase n=1 Tax=Pseudonocardia sp. NPDC046786 TaxID=3155471 RepID=UPI0033E5CD38
MAVGVLLLLVVAALTVWCLTRVRRLHRLHARVDAARSGLAAALERRVRVALKVAELLDPPRGASLAAAATAAGAGSAPAADGRDPAGTRESREMAENTLTRELAALGGAVPDPRLAAELDDAQQLVVLARRVHNDAVRDTRVLRSRRLVRRLQLYGTAPEPVYFEIVDPEPVSSRYRADVGSTRHRTVM